MPPTAIPMNVPHGHVVQQLLDSQGNLAHIIMSQEMPPPQVMGPGQPQIHQRHSQVFLILNDWIFQLFFKEFASTPAAAFATTTEAALESKSSKMRYTLVAI